jgi:nucleoside-diphosphate-sugar epimerase
MIQSGKKINVLITGAAGNLGGLSALYLRDDPAIDLSLMIHHKDVSRTLQHDSRIKIFRADLSDKDTLMPALRNIDVVVHFAGMLFSHNPEKFLPITNLAYFTNLLDAAIENNVKKMILISFPHVEGESFHDKPATGLLTGNPVSVHASTRLAEEKYLFSKADKTLSPVSLRVCMVYGKGILMIDAAKWLLRYRLLGIWRKPTWIHLI